MIIENTVIACLLADPDTEFYLNSISEEDFSLAENKQIIKIIKDLHLQGQKIDYVTVSNKMPWSELNIKTLPVLDYNFKTSMISEYIAELKRETARKKLKKLLTESERKLIAGEELKEVVDSILNAISDISTIDSKKLVDVGEIDTNNYMNREKVKSQFKNLDKMIGGFAMGELSIWTGRSGQGKSTFLSQLMLNTVNQGIKVCAYSGELINEQFQYWLILQACGIANLEKRFDEVKYCDIYMPKREAVQKIKSWLKGKFYLYNNEFTGKDNNIIEVFKYAYKTHGCRVFLVDNLMTAKYDYNARDNYYIQQSGFVGELVRFAKTYDVHVHLIAHPKKTVGELTKEDIAGTLDITNRADNTFSVNRDEDTNSTIINILKNRSDGIQNKQVAFDFDVKTKRFTPKGSEMSQFKRYGWEAE